MPYGEFSSLSKVNCLSQCTLSQCEKGMSLCGISILCHPLEWSTPQQRGACSLNFIQMRSEALGHRTPLRHRVMRLYETLSSVSSLITIRMSNRSFLPRVPFWGLSPHLSGCSPRWGAPPRNSPAPTQTRVIISEKAVSANDKTQVGKIGNYIKKKKRHKIVSAYQSDAVPSEQKTMERMKIVQLNMIHFEQSLINSGTPPLLPSSPLHHLSTFV